VQGTVLHRPSGRRASFGALVRAAADLPLPQEVALRPDAELTLIGRDQRRKDIPAKVTGQAGFAADLQLPRMLTATVRASPVFGSRLVEVDEAPALALPGVRAVVELPDAVAVVADGYWQAATALDALAPRFAETDHDAVDSAAMAARLQAALGEEGGVVAEQGVLPAAGTGGLQRFEVEYEVPYLAHATMEPMSCVALVTDTGCELWAPTQGPIRLRDAVAEALGLDATQVKVQRTFAGGGFGRRWQVDFGVQAALIARAVKGRPVRLVWSREEDMRHDFYRPAFAMRAAATLDASRALVALDVTLAGASILEQGRPGRLQGKPDPLAVSTFDAIPYAIPSYRLRWVQVPGHVPVGVWRSVGQSHNGFFLECLVDEIAARAGRDPLDFRLEALEGKPRLQHVLRTVATLAGWGEALPPGEGRGLALVEDQGSTVAQVARVRVADGRLRVLQVCCAIDCGRAIQPEVIRMQMESGIVFGLSALLYGEITLASGAVRQSNFHDYRVLSLADTPEIRVEIIEGGPPLGGVGEPGVPPLAPAVVNALHAATGRRVRTLPLARHGLV
jgi:isoquinoline 1-oxidoreductase beta subunit